MNLPPDVEVFLDHLTVERGLSRNTLLAYRRDITRYFEFLEGRGKEIAEARESDIDDFLSHLRSGDFVARRNGKA